MERVKSLVSLSWRVSDPSPGSHFLLPHMMILFYMVIRILPEYLSTEEVFSQCGSLELHCKI
jgi:hypothetical protein